jgi:hypothetical protein
MQNKGSEGFEREKPSELRLNVNQWHKMRIGGVIHVTPVIIKYELPSTNMVRESEHI